MKLRRWIGTLLGAGFLPLAPGTWGSAAACALMYVVLIFSNNSQWPLVAGLLIFSLLSVVLGNYAAADFGREDPGPFVLDEAGGICLTLLGQPLGQGRSLLFVVAAAFVAFRIFDVTKPFPARRLENLPGGWGILLDDLAAAVYANALCQILLRFIFS